MASRNLIVLGIALLMGVIAVYLANTYFSSMEARNDRIAQNLNLSGIVTARVPLAYGDTITAEKLQVTPWPAASVPQGAFTDIDALTTGAEGPRVAIRPVEPGVPLLPPMLSGPGGHAPLSASLSRDKRAVAIRVNDVSGVGGFIAPGDSVDVLLTREAASGGSGQGVQITDTIIENIRVIGTDQNANEGSKDPQVSKAVTVEVDPTQAQKIALAGQIGQLSLALRNVANREPAETRTVTIADLRSSNASLSPLPREQAPVMRRAVVRRPPAQTAPTALTILVGKGLSVSNIEVSREAGN